MYNTQSWFKVESSFNDAIIALRTGNVFEFAIGRLKPELVAASKECDAAGVVDTEFLSV